MKTKESIARALRQVVSDLHRRSGLGEVWRDDSTWNELSTGLVAALGRSLVLVDKETYANLIHDARQMQRIRQHVAEYHARGSKEQQSLNADRNPYAKWAAENMGGGGNR